MVVKHTHIDWTINTNIRPKSKIEFQRKAGLLKDCLLDQMLTPDAISEICGPETTVLEFSVPTMGIEIGKSQAGRRLHVHLQTFIKHDNPLFNCVEMSLRLKKWIETHFVDGSGVPYIRGAYLRFKLLESSKALNYAMKEQNSVTTDLTQMD